LNAIKYWLPLDHFGEDISSVPGGLVCCNRETHQVRLYKIEFLVRAISRDGESLHLTADGGYAVLRNNTLQEVSGIRRGVRWNGRTDEKNEIVGPSYCFWAV